MTYESVSFTQADLRTVRKSTTERKIMSTKTSIKRIALVAVAALGFGMVSTVSANAAQTLIAVSDIEMTGTGSSDAYVLSGAASIANTATVTTATPVAFGWKITDPSGDVSYIGTDFANATVGTVSAVASKASTLTFATGFLAETGKWTVTIVAEDADATELDSQAEIITAVAATSESENFFVYKTTPSFTGGLGSTVTSATAIAQTVNGTATVFVVSDDTSSSYTVSSSGVGSLLSAYGNNTGKSTTELTATTGDTVSLNNGTTVAGGVTWTPNVKKKSFLQVKATSAIAGAQTISVTPLDANGTPGSTVSATITWGSAITVSTASTAYMAGPADTTASATTNAVPRSAAKASGTAIATIVISLLNTSGTADARANTVKATVSGVGYVDVDGTAASLANSSQRVESNTEADASRFVRIYSDGTAGTGSVTVTVTDVTSGSSITLGTWSYTSTGSVASIALDTTNYTIGRAGYTTGGASATRADATEIGGVAAPATVVVQGDGTQTTTPAFVVVTKDSTGAVASIASSGVPTIVSSDLAIVSGGTCVKDNGSDSDYSSSSNGVGYYNCNFTTVAGAASGSKATLTIRTSDPASTTGGYLTTTLDVTVGGKVATETLTTDKASYAPGEAMVITRTAKDASGNPVYDGAAAPAVSASKSLGGTTPGASIYVGGKKATSATKPTVFAPAVAGDFIIKMTSGNATADLITTPLTVDDANSTAAVDAANEATDAANAATDAANAAAEAADAATAAAQDAQAAVAALATSVSSLIAGIKAQITSLTNLVIKIQKKVKA